MVVTHDKLKFVGGLVGAHPQRKLHQREAVEPLAALAGVEVCELLFATSVPPVFADILEIQS